MTVLLLTKIIIYAIIIYFASNAGKVARSSKQSTTERTGPVS
jgi:hypothetical protein